MRLFAFYMGGKVKGCRIEAHDVAFCVAETVEDCYPSLKAQWFGERKGLHIDVHAALTCADGHEIRVVKKGEVSEDSGDRQLYFINLGGYEKTGFAEIHRMGFVVAASPQEAKKRARKELGGGIKALHTDNLLDVDDCLNVAESLDDYALALIPSENAQPVAYVYGYKLLL